MSLRPVCQAITALLSQQLDEAMSPDDRSRLHLHLVGCTACRAADAQLTFIRRAVHQLRDHRPSRPDDGVAGRQRSRLPFD